VLSMTSFQSVHRWLDANGLCLNPDKSGAIVIGTNARQRSEPQISDVTIAVVTVPVTRTDKSLGVNVGAFYGSYTHPHTHTTIYSPLGFCPGLPG